MEGQNVVEGGLVYDGEFGGFGFLASVVGLYGELKNDAEDAFGNDEWYGWQAGANVDLFGFKLGRRLRPQIMSATPRTTSSPPASATASAR